MGQYYKLVNLTKREYIHPHALGAGLKLIEQVGTYPSIGSALLVLLACSNGRGGGDLADNPIIGKWAGDRLALVGDYAEDNDLEQRDHGGVIYNLCDSPEAIEGQIEHLRGIVEKSKDSAAAARYLEKIDDLQTLTPYRDISAEVAAVIESAVGFKYTGDGWRDIEYNDGVDQSKKTLAPDMVISTAPPSEEKRP